MKDKNLTMGYLALHDNKCTIDASIVQILRNAGGKPCSRLALLSALTDTIAQM